MGGGRNFSQGSMPPTPLLYTIVSPSLYEHSPKKILTTLPGPGIYGSIFKVTILGGTNSTVAPHNHPPKNKSHHATGKN